MTCLVLLCISKGKILNSVTDIVSQSLVNEELQKQLMKVMELRTWGQGVSNLSIDLIDLLTQDVTLPNRPGSCSLKFVSRDQHKCVSTDLCLDSARCLISELRKGDCLVDSMNPQHL